MNIHQINFAYRIRHALNERAEDLSSGTTSRLAQARARALARKKADAPRRATVLQNAFADNAAGAFANRLSWMARMGVVIPVVIVAAGIFTLYQSANQQRISDVAEIDAMVLSDELPLKAYIDKGFNAYLARSTE